jgi:hypothetical protein
MQGKPENHLYQLQSADRSHSVHTHAFVAYHVHAIQENKLNGPISDLPSTTMATVTVVLCEKPTLLQETVTLARMRPVWLSVKPFLGRMKREGRERKRERV